MVDSSFNVSCDASFNSNVDICGNLDVSGSFTCGSFAVSSLDLSYLVVDSSFNVYCDASFNSNVDICGNLDVSGSFTCGSFAVSSLDVSFLVVDSSFNVSCDASFNNNVDICGNLDVSGTFTCGGSVTVSTLDVSNLVVNSSFKVSCDASFNNNVDIYGNLDVSGTLHVSYLSVVHDASFGNNVYMTNNLDVSGSLDVSYISVVHDATFGSNVDVKGNLDVSGNFTCDGSVNLATLSVRDFAATNSFNVTCDASFGKALNVDGATTLDSLTVGYVTQDLTDTTSTQYGCFSYNSTAAASTTYLYNSAFGRQTLSAINSGGLNTAVGAYSSANIQDGSYNCSFGYGSLMNNVSGSFNTCIGHDAQSNGDVATTENVSFTTCIGANTKARHDYSTAIGYGAQTTASNQIVLGVNDADRQDTVVIPYMLNVEDSLSVTNYTTLNYLTVNSDLDASYLKVTQNADFQNDVTVTGKTTTSTLQVNGTSTVEYVSQSLTDPTSTQFNAYNTTNSFSSSNLGYNSAFGSGALGSITTGNESTAVGCAAGTSQTNAGSCCYLGFSSGIANNSNGGTYIGVYAARYIDACGNFSSRTTNYNNTCLGNASFYNFTTGTDNVSVGAYSMAGFETQDFDWYQKADYCTVVGTNSGASIYQHNDIVCLGYKADCSGNYGISIGSGTKVNGIYGIAIGNTSCYTYGDLNVAIGYAAQCGNSLTNTSVTGSIAIGDGASCVNSYSVALGYNAVCSTGDRTMQIGSNNNADYPYSVYFGLTSATNCYANSFVMSSDYRIKENVKPLTDAYSIDALRPVSYNKTNAPDKKCFGFIAHELQDIFPELVTGEKDGEQMQSVNYIGLIPILVKEIQSLKQRVTVLENALHLSV